MATLRSSPFLRFVPVIVAAIANAANLKSPDTILAVLQEVPAPPATDKLISALRLAFRHDEDGWHPICDSKPSPPWDTACRFAMASSPLEWQVTRAGRPIGKVTTKGWMSERWYSQAGLLLITSTPIPEVGPRSREFNGWASENTLRPLVAIRGGVSPLRSSQWANITPTSADKKRVFAAFRKLVPRIPSCQQDDQGKPIGHDRATRLTDVEVINAVESPDKRKLIGMHVTRALLETCDGWGEFADDAWFSVTSAGVVRALPDHREKDGWSHALTLIDIGDFDGDGSDEAIFWYAGYDEDGYVLYQNNFNQAVRFTWGYH